jgi:hypothetical protein
MKIHSAFYKVLEKFEVELPQIGSCSQLGIKIQGDKPSEFCFVEASLMKCSREDP